MVAKLYDESHGNPHGHCNDLNGLGPGDSRHLLRAREKVLQGGDMMTTSHSWERTAPKSSSHSFSLERSSSRRLAMSTSRILSDIFCCLQCFSRKCLTSAFRGCPQNKYSTLNAGLSRVPGVCQSSLAGVRESPDNCWTTLSCSLAACSP